MLPTHLLFATLLSALSPASLPCPPSSSSSPSDIIHSGQRPKGLDIDINSLWKNGSRMFHNQCQQTYQAMSCHAIPDITTYLIVTISTKFKFTDHADSKYRTVRINESQDYCPSWGVCEKYQKRNGLVFWSTMYIYVSWQWRVAHWVYVIHTYTNLIPAFPRSVAPPLPSATVNNC